MNINGAIRDGVKLATSGSVQMMIGGIVAAVVPKNISIIYKVAAYVGSTVVAAFTGEKLDEYIDGKIDEVKETVDTVKDIIEKAKENIKTEEMGA